jgi:hypothetical protein
MTDQAELMRQLADMRDRVVRLEEAPPDPRITAALETAQEALTTAASAADIRKITERLDQELKALNSRVPKSRSVAADDPLVPDPNQNQNPDDPAGQPSTPPPTPGSTLPAPTSEPPRKKRRF